MIMARNLKPTREATTSFIDENVQSIGRPFLPKANPQMSEAMCPMSNVH